ncbi:MAG: glycosyltransferase [Elusimicrobia bacterium]|nr:glycosyltransferase [Elusimicrobiota bacterium]
MLKKKIYGLWLIFLVMLFGIDFAKQFDSYLRFKRKLNLKNPQTLADKVSYLFLHKQTPLMSNCTDKWNVREYITGKGLSDILIPTVGDPWNKVEEIDFDKLPKEFILKATHGCKMNYIVKDKSKLNLVNCKKTLQIWLNTTYGVYSLETHYKKIPHRIYAEQLLETQKSLIDYKFHCLNGVPQFILVCSDRNSSGKSMQVTLDLFDTNWESLNTYLQPSGLEVVGQNNINKPEKFQQMLSIATILSKDFSFVRVDLYEIEGKIYFGELTFSPACGVFPNFKDNFITDMGKRLKI